MRLYRDRHLMAATENATGWHLDRKVPVAIICTLLVQIVGFGWLFGQVENRVAQLERRMDTQAAVVRDLPEKIGRLDEQVRAVRTTLDRIDRKLSAP